MDPETRQTHVLVAEDQLSLAIGKEGQNVRLAARLTGWKIDIKDKAKYDYAAEDAKFAETRAQHASEEFDEVEEILEEEVSPTETQIHEEIPLEKFSSQQLSEQLVNLEQEKTELLEENEIFETTKEESV